MSARRAEGVTDRPLVLANLSRRGFLQGMTAAGAFVLAAGYTEAARAADPPKYGADGMPNGWVDDPLVFVAIAPDGIVSITCHRSEMGQGVRTGMPMIVADELEADWKRVRVVQAPGDETLRQPGYRRLAQHAPFLRSDAALRCGGSHHARGCRGQALGRAGERGGGPEP